jgi:NADPH:quinone reductase-like Zn-dependent oxidoreductase
MGVVEANGPGAGKYPPGTRVTAAVWPNYRTAGQGLWQQYVAVEEEYLVGGWGVLLISGAVYCSQQHCSRL